MNKLFILGAAAITAICAGPAAAQQGASGARSQSLTLAAFEARIASKFAATDANRDGFISRTEAEAASSARPDRGQRVAAREHRKAKRASRVARVDTNKDGVVSAAERQARVAARGPNVVRRAARVEQRTARRVERQALRGKVGLRLNEKRFAKLDANGDGRLTIAEATSRVAVRFARLDKNGDASVTREERREARAQRQTRRNG